MTLPDLPTLAWVALALLAAGTLAAMVRALAGAVLVQTDWHDLVLEVQRLRDAHERMLAALRGDPEPEIGEVDIIDDPAPEAAQPAPTAVAVPEAVAA